MADSGRDRDLEVSADGPVIDNGITSASVTGFGSIPTTDPGAALQFCRHLAQLLTSSSAFPAVDTGRPRLKGTADGAVQARPPRPDLSVVIPVYNEYESLPVLYERLTRVLRNTKSDFEIVFVNDGSHDQSAEFLRDLVAQDRHVVVVELARNFGHQVAISAGLDFSRGNGVIIMDADMQDPPEVLPEFISKWREGYDVVYAIREHRKEGWLKRTAYTVFYRLLRGLANVDIPLDAGDFCIMDRRVVELLRSMPERNRFLRGIRSWVGLRQMGLPYQRHPRHAGRTKYTHGRLMLLALDGFISFSHVPLRIASLSGLVTSLLSFLLGSFYLAKKITTGLNPPGFATLVVAILFLAGVQLTTIGIMGEYVGRVFDEVKGRPLYVVHRVTRHDG